MHGLRILTTVLLAATISYAQEKPGELLTDDFKVIESPDIITPEAERTENGVTGSEKSIAALAALKEGNTLWRAGSISLAAASYQRAIDIQPELYPAQFNLGIALLRMNKYGEAERLFEKAVALKEDSAAAWEGLGFAHYYQKHYALAVASFEHAQSITPDDAEINNNLGFAYLFHNPQEAISAFHTALRLDPKFAPAMNGLCCAYSLAARHNDAVTACSNAVSSNGDSAVPHYFLGLAYLELGKLKKAVNALGEAALLEPGTARIYVALGFAHFKLTQYQQALGHFQHARKLDPDVDQALLGIGATYTHLRDFGRAEKVLREAVSSHDAPVVRYNLGVVCLARKNRDCALSQRNYLKIMDHSLAKSLFNLLFQGQIIDAAGYQGKPH